MKPKVVITQRVHQEVLDLLSSSCEVVANMTTEPWPPEQLRAMCRDAKGVMVFMPDSIDGDFLDNCPELEVVGAALKGYDNFDVQACTDRGIWFTNVPDLLTIPTAELTVGLMIGLSRHMQEGDRFVRSGRFQGWRPHLYGTGLAGSTVGIVGMGAVGRATARCLQGFSANLIYYDQQPLLPEKEQELSLTLRPFEKLLEESDFTVVILPLTEKTYQMIDKTAISRMKEGGFLVNTGRGSVVDEEAVVEALASGRLAGYAADVFVMEDWAWSERSTVIPTELLKNQSQTFLTPHLGSAVNTVRLDIAMEAAENILQALAGDTPQGALNQPKARCIVGER
ncbi:MAG: phosphonate dehydrogenase [Geobacter sp.]|uniref:phosphonate dehydrogenase n=1 Tax=Trichlorobacter lovleyi TaxID=313985 RepID=UPI0023F52890|nr:phosphonate dehydrogenase [Trichlorobacter lovleyi]